MNKFLALLLIAALTVSCAVPKQKSAKQTPVTTAGTPSPEKKSDKKTYKDIITKKTKTDTGLFNVHESEGKYYYEIPSKLLGKDMLWVTCIAQIPENLSPYLNAGSKTNEQVVRWEIKNDKLLLKSISFHNIASDQGCRI